VDIGGGQRSQDRSQGSRGWRQASALPERAPASRQETGPASCWNRERTVARNSVRVSVVPHTSPSLPSFTRWPSFPFEGDLRVKELDDPVAVEPARKGEDAADCVACNAPDEAYIWVSERWRVRAMDRPSGLPMVLILESRSHLDLGDLPNLLAAELGVMTVRLERAIRSLDGVARVHVNRWGDGSAHLHLWFLARPYGRLQLRGTFLPLWDDILPPIPESQWRENLALIAAWLAEFEGRPLAEPPRIQWQAPSSLGR
jgi:diadenosine tetraphosphate (Ap4A) HIT family hydrolase